MPKNQDKVEGLTAELERAALRAVFSAYSDLNDNLFNGRLQRCRLELVESRARLGRWVSEHRTIELSRSLLSCHGWGVLVEVLKHEMAHQYLTEIEGAYEAPHGPAFRRICEERGIDPRASGIPDGAGELGRAQAHSQVLERVAKLLALAQSPNEHEAQNAMSAAQRLMLKYNIEASLGGRAPSYGFRHLGRPSGRITEAERRLANILSEHFFVECIWVPVWRPLEGKRGSMLEVCGRPENLELAEYVHSFLTRTADALWREYKRSRAVQGNANRRSYVAGVMIGFQDKLRSERTKNQGAGLVWVGDGELSEWFRKRFPRIRRFSRTGPRRTAAYSHGREAGQRIVLHRGVSANSGAMRGLLSK